MKRDPERKGINVLVNQHIDTRGSGAAAGTQIDPATGLPAAAAPAESVDISQISIKIIPPLRDVTLGQALDAIVKVADNPIKYSIEDYAVVFSLKRGDVPPLYIRAIKVDPNTFIQGLQGVTGISFGASTVGSSGGGGGGGG